MTGYDSISTLIELDLKKNLIAASVPEVQKLVMFNRSCHYCTLYLEVPELMLRAARDALAMSNGPFKDYAYQLLLSLTGETAEMDGAFAQSPFAKKWMFGFSKFQPAPFLKLSTPKIGWWMDGQAMKHDENLQFAGPKKIEPYPRLRVTERDQVMSLQPGWYSLMMVLDYASDALKHLQQRSVWNLGRKPQLQCLKNENDDTLNSEVAKFWTNQHFLVEMLQDFPPKTLVSSLKNLDIFGLAVLGSYWIPSSIWGALPLQKRRRGRRGLR